MNRLAKLAVWTLPGAFAGAMTAYYTVGHSQPTLQTAQAELGALNPCTLEKLDAKRAICEYVLKNTSHEMVKASKENYERAYQDLHARRPKEDEVLAFIRACALAQMVAAMIEDINAGKTTLETKLFYATYSLAIERDIKSATRDAGLDFNNDTHVAMFGINPAQMPFFRELMKIPVIPAPSRPQPQLTPRPIA